MLLSRKRALSDLRGPEELLAVKSSSVSMDDDAQRLLRDLPAPRDALLDLLGRLHERDAASAAPDRSLKMSRARLSSQELFLSVVLEWQRSSEDARLEYSTSRESPTAAIFRHDRAFTSVHDDAHSSSSSSYASSDEEHDGIPLRKSLEEVSPTSVHNVPGVLTPLNLDAVNSMSSPMKRIGMYTPRARQQLLEKYMAKRARRLSQNKVRYGVRKTLANARPRVKGRFVKTEVPLTAAIVESRTAVTDKP